MLWILNRINNPAYLLFGWNNRQLFIVMQEWHFTPVPVFMKDIVVEVPELGDMYIDRAWIKTFDILEESYIGTHFLPRHRGKGTIRQILFYLQDICGQIRCVCSDGCKRKITERKDILVFFKENCIVLIHCLTS